ncbi:MAG: DinB family protein [Chitinophagaceae bacterium]
MPRPITGEAPEYFFKYIGLTEGDSIQSIINNHSKNLVDFYNTIPDEKAEYAYAEGKWTVKQVLQHLIDTERVFVYRALCFARMQTIPLPGMDENAFAENAKMDNRSLAQIKAELISVRKSTDLFLQSLSANDCKMQGNASGKDMSVNALAYIIYGHVIHHKNIIEKRYL